MDRSTEVLIRRLASAVAGILPALSLLGTIALAGCDQRATPPTTPTPVAPEAADTVRILFVGNSLTYFNDLPGMVAALSRAAGDAPPIETAAVTFGGYALQDHLAQGDAALAIRRGGWDVVVLQQGPSSLPASRVNLIEYARQFGVLIREVGARPALYGVWPERARISALDACIESYRAAADSVGGLSCPAALAWKIAWQADPSLPLYGPDQFHPSPLGTYAAACVIYAVVRNRSPQELPARFDVSGALVTLDSLQAHTVRMAAAGASGGHDAQSPEHALGIFSTASRSGRSVIDRAP